MAKKKRLSDDAFAWIKDTTRGAEEAEQQEDKAERQAAGKPAAGTAEYASAAKKAAKPVEQSAKQVKSAKRSIVVKYHKENGLIAAIQEASGKRDVVAMELQSSAAEGMKIVKFVLKGELLSKELIEIHTGYKVEVSSKKPALVPSSK